MTEKDRDPEQYTEPMNDRIDIGGLTFSNEFDKIADVVWKIQAKLKPAELNAVGSVGQGRKYKFANLHSIWDATQAILSESKVAVFQGPYVQGRDVSVTTMLVETKSGQWVSSTTTCQARSEDPQQVGSAITYMRRYGLAPILGVIVEDDDGSAATHGDQPQPKQQSAPPRKQDAPQPSNGDEVLMPVGKEKGKPIEGFKTRGLEWWVDKLGENIADPDYQYDKEQAKYNLEIIQAELARRGGQQTIPAGEQVADNDCPF